MKSVVVTGVSTGIGLGTAKVLLANGFQVFGSLRKAEEGERLGKELGTSFRPLIFDVTDDAAIAAAAGEVRQALDGERLAGLVNNAGVAVPGPLLHITIEEFRHQMAVNLIGQLAVTQAFLPLLGTERDLAGPPGRIIMMSSVAGQSAVAFLGPYAASKHALEGMSKSLRQELLMFGIDVIVIAPGAIATPIWDKADDIDIGRYHESPFRDVLHKMRQAMVRDGRSGLPPEEVGKVVLQALTVKRPKPRYRVGREKWLHGLLPLMPQRLVDRMIDRAYGLSGQSQRNDDP